MLGVFKSSEISIECTSVLFLPTEQLDEATLLNGKVRLNLRRKAQVELKISLVGRCTINIPGRDSESKIVLDQNLSLREEEELPPGEHVFTFEFEVPNRAQASVSLPHGTISYSVLASAGGLSWAGYNLETEKPLKVVWSPGGESAAPPGLEVYILERSPDFGNYMFDVFSPALTVGGLLSTSIHVRNARKRGCQILSLTVLVRQKVSISALSGDCAVHMPPVEEHVLSSTEDIHKVDMKFWYRSSTGHALCPLPRGFVQMSGEPGEMRSITRRLEGVPDNLELVRLPDDLILAPSTHKDDQSPIKVSHEILLRVLYRDAAGKGRLVTVSRALPLASCSCMYETLTLPSYTRKQQQGTLRDGVLCVCSESLDEILNENREAIVAFSGRCDDPERHNTDKRSIRPKEEITQSS